MIRFEHVTKKLGRRNVLDDCCFEINKGEIFVIVGFSGAGKSVTLKHMVRLLTPDSGKVWVGDDCVSAAHGVELERIRARFGYLFQSGALLQWLDVGQNVGLPLREHTKMKDADIDALAMEKLKLVNLDEAWDKMPDNISGGMRKRVALARALITKPEILLYDEPTSGLDPVTSRQIDTLIDDTRKQTGVTSIIVTHDLHSALAIGTRIAMLYEGQIIELSKPADFVRSKNPMVRSFLEAQYITVRGEWEDHIK